MDASWPESTIQLFAAHILHVRRWQNTTVVVGLCIGFACHSLRTVYYGDNSTQRESIDTSFYLIQGYEIWSHSLLGYSNVTTLTKTMIDAVMVTKNKIILQKGQVCRLQRIFQLRFESCRVDGSRCQMAVDMLELEWWLLAILLLPILLPDDPNITSQIITMDNPNQKWPRIVNRIPSKSIVELWWGRVGLSAVTLVSKISAIRSPRRNGWPIKIFDGNW